MKKTVYVTLIVMETVAASAQEIGNEVGLDVNIMCARPSPRNWGEVQCCPE